jgi:hypothetical protein
MPVLLNRPIARVPQKSPNLPQELTDLGCEGAA